MTSITGPVTKQGKKKDTDKKMKPAKNHNSADCGLTLLELVLVMVILCTVLAMAAPQLRGFFATRQTLDAAAQILALTQLARTQAISEGHVYRLNLDEQENTYWLTVQDKGAFRKLYSEFGRSFSLPEDTLMQLQDTNTDDSTHYIEFTPDGKTQTGTIRLTNRRGDIIEIKCLSPTELFHVVIPEKSNVNRKAL